ncbi:hypothetical protein [Luteolibacter sp. LG18]|uniref:hypothetical protein n=1 Tax=Luteolibacter sp. LG18 TaxID=2819286 RepID=UPI002B29B0F1|nr:hypothetical protein llg_09710 [Luteolibacter sp. LG18]
MESHEWRERTEEGVRYYRANRHANKWTFITTLKTDPDWETVDPVPEALWRELRDVLWRKYQRKRCPWKFIEDIDKMLGDEPKPEGR